MKERPSIFSGAMVRAIMAGTKTQTRRAVKPQPGESYSIIGNARESRGWSWPLRDGQCLPRPGDAMRSLCPYGVPGDRLWVREAWQVARHEPCFAHERDWQSLLSPTVRYPADGAERRLQLDRATTGAYHGVVEKSRPSIHMPRWASRITLDVIGVRVERLQEISEADAMAEGAEPVLVPPDGGSCPHVEGFRQLWGSINGPSSWESNPWVWCVEFQRRP